MRRKRTCYNKSDIVDWILREIQDGHREALEEYVRATAGDYFNVACVRLRLRHGLKLERVTETIDDASKYFELDKKEIAMILYQELELQLSTSRLGIFPA